MPRLLRALSRLLVALVTLPLLVVLFYVVTGLWGDRDLASLWRTSFACDPDFTVALESLEPAAYESAVYLGLLENPRLVEASGLAASRRRDDLLWLINDGGNAPELHALGLDGRNLGSFALPDGDWNQDWEGLASFEYQGSAYLLIGDVGDNNSWNRTSRLLFVHEPELARDAAQDPNASPGRVEVAWIQEFRFEDGPHDCEALAVDAEAQKVLLLSKRNVPPTLYELPLQRAGDGDPPLVARAIASLDSIPRPTEEEREMFGWRSRWLSRPTALDLSPQGDQAAVLTYWHGYLYPRAPGESWADAFARPPRHLRLPPLEQGEALGFSRDGRQLYLTTEQRPAPLFRLQRSAVR